MTQRRSAWLAGVIAALAVLGSIAPAHGAESESAIARGGRLYDKWFAENKAAKPTADHPAYTVKDGKYGKDASWRCKECHGWDYLGKDGAYAKGGHATGIKGIGAAGVAAEAERRAEPGAGIGDVVRQPRSQRDERRGGDVLGQADDPR